MVNVFGALFFLVASGIVVVCKNNARVLGRSGPERGKKKDTVVCLAGARSLLRPEKKDTVVCLAGARSLFFVGRLDMYHTYVLLYRTMVLMARPTKVRH